MKRICSYLTLCGLFTLVPGCGQNRKKSVAHPTKMVHDVTVKLTKKVADTGRLPAITVWVHGSQFFRTASEIFHGAPDGLHAMSDLPSYYRVRTFAHMLTTMDPVRFNAEHFYAFGWPGDLDFSLREREARKLLTSLKKLVAQYRIDYGVTPEIRIITHSHGGNVALNLAKVKDSTIDFTITELILLACPIQEATSHLAQDPLFTRAYSLYSTLDSIQVLDPQGMYKHTPQTERTLKFSERQLPASDNLRQVRIRINGHSLLHLSFITKGFLKALPTILDQIDAWQESQPQSQNPDAERLLSLHTRKPLIAKQYRASNTP